jgi:hypothetical protein
MNPNEPPYELICRLWQEGKVLPILGPGVQLAFHDWQSGSPSPLVGHELAKMLADRLSLSHDETYDLDPAVVASYYMSLVGRREFYSWLKTAFDRTAEPNPLHRLIASFNQQQLIVVTTPDAALEQAFDFIEAKYDVVAHSDARNASCSVYWWPYTAVEPIVARPHDLDIDLDSTTVIYKLFGTVDRKKRRWDTFIVAEEDILELVASLLRGSAIPAAFLPYIAEKSALYLGFGLGSWLNRILLRTFSNASPGAKQRVSWAITMRPRPMDLHLWQRQNVVVYDLDLRTFSENMARAAESLSLRDK